MSETMKLISELAAITAQIKTLTDRKKEIEGSLLIRGGEDIKDTKLKSVEYTDEQGNKVTYTEAQSLTVVSPEYLKKLFGSAYKDIVKEETETTYKIASKQFERMLAALYLDDYSRITLDDFWRQLPCDESVKKALRRKLKGTDFSKDKGFLMSVGGFSEPDAIDYAYMYADALVWSTLAAVCELAEMPPNEENLDLLIRGVHAAVSVSETSKLKLERKGNGES